MRLVFGKGSAQKQITAKNGNRVRKKGAAGELPPPETAKPRRGRFYVEATCKTSSKKRENP